MMLDSTLSSTICTSVEDDVYTLTPTPHTHDVLVPQREQILRQLVLGGFRSRTHQNSIREVPHLIEIEQRGLGGERHVAHVRGAHEHVEFQWKEIEEREQRAGDLVTGSRQQA